MTKIIMLLSRGVVPSSNAVKYLLSVALMFSLVATSGVSSAKDFSQGRLKKLGFDKQRIERLDNVLQSYVDKQQIAGSVALVLKDGKIAYSSAKGMQSIESSTAMSKDSLFRIASQTKAIVSTAIMMLHERGDLLISDPLSKYLPEWADSKVAEPNEDGSYQVVAANRAITLRDLLTHTSGIGYGMGGVANEEWEAAGVTGWYLAGRDESIRETVRRMAALPQQDHPGESWIYGYNIDILGAVVEVASGKSLAEFLETEIFQPLDMNDTHFFLPASKADRLSTVYSPAEVGVKPVPVGSDMQSQGAYIQGMGPSKNYSGGAGLVSSASDYASFLQMTLDEGELDGVRLLSPKTIELMTANQLFDIQFGPGVGMGLGFSVAEDLGVRGQLGSAGEYGWGGAYHSTYWVDPEEDLVVVYLTQTINIGSGLDDFGKLRALLYGALVD